MPLDTKPFPESVLAKLTANYAETAAAQAAGQPEPDHWPVVKVFNPQGAGTWLLTELLPDGDTLFGLCVLSEAELGYVSKAELESVVGRLGLRIERDVFFEAEGPLALYLEKAKRGEPV